MQCFQSYLFFLTFLVLSSRSRSRSSRIVNRNITLTAADNATEEIDYNIHLDSENEFSINSDPETNVSGGGSDDKQQKIERIQGKILQKMYICNNVTHVSIDKG